MADNNSSVNTKNEGEGMSGGDGQFMQSMPGPTLPEVKKKPIACIIIGMAGSGKTTFMQVCSDCIQSIPIDSPLN